MKIFAGLLYCLILTAASDDLYRSERFFELRRAADNSRFRPVLDARFGHETESLATLPGLLPERKAHEELAGALLRLGRYGEAAAELSKALRLIPPDEPHRGETENSRMLYESLSDVAPQTIAFGESIPVHARQNGVGSWNVPVIVSGIAADWLFDTGANFSTMTDSEARRLGLKLRESKAHVGGSSGKNNPLRLAVADDLQFGPAHLKNVVFLIVADSSMYVAPVKFQINGILGLPVLRALETVGVGASGDVRIHQGAGVATGEPNFYFDELSPIVEVRHGGKSLQLLFDTGANTTTLYPSALDSLSVEERRKVRTKREKSGGVGGVIKHKVSVVDKLSIELGGRGLELSRVSVLPKQPPVDVGYRDGVLGMDALLHGFTIDFRSMQLSLD